MINLMLTIFLPNWVMSKPTQKGKCPIQSGSDVARLLKKNSLVPKIIFSKASPHYFLMELNIFLVMLAYI